MSSVTSYRTEAAIKLLDQLDLVDLNVLLKDDNDVTNWYALSYGTSKLNRSLMYIQSHLIPLGWSSRKTFLALQIRWIG
jgi:hypothetical protein